MAEEKIWDWLPGFEFDEEVDLKEIKSWLIDLSHCIPRMTPMCANFWIKHGCHGQKFVADMLSVPTNKGVEFRTKHGVKLVGYPVVRDEEEIKQREAKFREAMHPFIEDFDGWWQKAKNELMAMYDKFKSFDLDRATNSELLYHLLELNTMNYRQWEIHFIGMVSSMNGWCLFENLCKDWWGLSDSAPEFQKLMAGFDNKMFQVDKRLWQLAQSAMDKGVADAIMATEAGEVISKLEQTEAGRGWVKELREFLNEDGWRIQHMHILYLPTWLEDPTPAIRRVKGFIAKGGGFVLEEVRGRLVREREEAEAAIMQRVPAEQKEWFMMLLRFAQKAGAYNEEHTYYCDFYSRAVIRRSLLGIGRRLAGAGTIDRPDDIFFLNPDEVERVIDLPNITTCAILWTGGIRNGRSRLRWNFPSLP